MRIIQFLRDYSIVFMLVTFVLILALTFWPGRKPRFVRNFMADAGTNLQALKNFVAAVKKREYPAAEHSF